MTDEFEKIRLLAHELGPPGEGVMLGIGDDAAILDAASPQALTVDVTVEGVHFRRSFADWRTLGRRAYAAAVSDIAAVGAQPRAALVSLILPSEFLDEDLRAIGQGLADLGREIDAPVIGGNLARGREVSISTTVVGSASQAVTRRDGAHPGDCVFVTGVVGAAALGLRCLLAPSDDFPDAQPFVEAWRRPVPRISEGLALSGAATASIDLSDGLVQDAGHLAKASAVQVRLFADQVPLKPDHESIAGRLGVDGTHAALTGGEDYELLFTLPAGAEPPITATFIGEIHDGSGVEVVGADDKRLALGHTGFSHFA